MNIQLPTVASIHSWLTASIQQLQTVGISTARLDCLILLEDCLNRDRAWLLAHPETTLTGPQIEQLDAWLNRRCQYEPLAYIRGHTEFYGRKFFVDKHVLVPRPESEAMIWLLKTLPMTPQTSLADIGSGSGCLGVTAALELGLRQVSFHDIDPATLVIARHNAQMYGLDGQFQTVDLLASGNYDVVLANLPYVPDDYAVNQAAQREPALALYGGADGLDLYRRLFDQAVAKVQPPLYIITESLPEQHKALSTIAQNIDYRLIQKQNFCQLFIMAR